MVENETTIVRHLCAEREVEGCFDVCFDAFVLMQSSFFLIGKLSLTRDLFCSSFLGSYLNSSSVQAPFPPKKYLAAFYRMIQRSNTSLKLLLFIVCTKAAFFYLS